MGRKKVYTEEELKERHKIQQKEADKRYKATEHGKKMIRAKSLIHNYKKEDILYGRETPDFDVKWVIENIFNKPCAYCGESDWTKLGCDRIDNSVGHIKSNVVCCCLHCNMVKPKEESWKIKYGHKKRVDQIDAITGEVLKTWECAEEAAEILGFNSSCIRQCCRGEKKKHMGYIWKYIQV